MRTYAAEGAMDLPIIPQMLILFWVQIIELPPFGLMLVTRVGEEEVGAGRLRQRSLPTPMSLKAEVMSLRRKHGSDRAICLFDLISVASTWVMCGYFDALFLVWKEADIHERFSIMARGIQFTPLSGIKLILLFMWEC
jgi:hypothetical protein